MRFEEGHDFIFQKGADGKKEHQIHLKSSTGEPINVLLVSEGLEEATTVHHTESPESSKVCRFFCSMIWLLCLVKVYQCYAHIMPLRGIFWSNSVIFVFVFSLYCMKSALRATVLL